MAAPACGGSTRPPESAPPPAAVEAPKEATAPAASSGEPASGWVLVPERLGVTSVEFVKPSFSLVLDGPRRLVQRQPGREGGVMLDEHRPRPLRKETTSIDLARLIPDDLELAPGEHQIVVCEESEGGRLCSGRAFSWTVEGKASELPFTVPDCLLWEPGGTYFGVDAIPFFALGAASEGTGRPIFYQIHHGDQTATVEAALHERLAFSLPVGDTRIELRCGQSQDVAGTRTITVNPEPAP